MQAQNDIDFSKIDWNLLPEEKAIFIYKETMEFHQSLIQSNAKFSDRAVRMLSFIMPVMTALAGYFAITWKEASIPLLFAGSCAGICLLIITINLLLILIPKYYIVAFKPVTYFTDGSYKMDMRGLLVNHIITLDKSILDVFKTLKKRSFQFRLAVTFCAILPITSFLAFLITSWFL
jgi:hypothetical protein